MTPSAASVESAGPPQQTSIRNELTFVYVGYCARYLQLMILIPFFARVLGAAEYGKVLAAMSLFGIVWMVVQYGFSPVGVRDIVSAGTPPEVARHFSRHLQARLLTAIAGIAVGAAGILFSPLLLEDPAFGIVVGFNLSWLFQAVNRLKTSVLLEVAGFVIYVVLTLTLVRDSGDGIFVLLSLLAASLITVVVSYFLASKNVDFRLIQLAGARPLINESGAMFVTTGLPMLMTSASTFLLGLFATAAEVGYFGAAERLASVVLSLMGPAGQVLVARITQQLNSPDTEADAFTLMRRSVFAMVCFGVIACAGSLLLSPYVIPLVFGTGFEPSITVMQVFAFAFPIVGFSTAVRIYVLFPLREDKSLAVTATVGAVVTVFAILLLAGQCGGPGVAAARVFAEVITAAMVVVACTRTTAFRQILGT
ncbi:MAG: oligosaccharide flippase family protein [Pseudomonadota bacterium]